MALAFNDTTNKNGIIQRCEMYCGMQDGNISGNTTLLKQFTALINSAYQKVVSSIMASQDDWTWDDTGTTDGTTFTQTTYPIATTALTTARDVTFPAVLKILKILRVDITYDGVNYYRATPMHTQEMSLGLGNDTNTDGRFDKTTPRYGLRGNGLFVYPRATASDVSAGATVRIEFSREPSEFSSTDTTKTLGLDTPFQPLVPLYASAEYCMSNAPQLYAPLVQASNDLEARLMKHVSRKEEDRDYYIGGQYVNYN